MPWIGWYLRPWARGRLPKIQRTCWMGTTTASPTSRCSMPWKALTRSASFRLVCDCWKSASVRSSRQRVVFGLGMAAETKKYRKSAEE